VIRILSDFDQNRKSTGKSIDQEKSATQEQRKISKFTFRKSTVVFDHALVTNPSTTSSQSYQVKNLPSTSIDKEKLPVACFLCPRRLESDLAFNLHLTSYHKVEVEPVEKDD